MLKGTQLIGPVKAQQRFFHFWLLAEHRRHLPANFETGLHGELVVALRPRMVAGGRYSLGLHHRRPSDEAVAHVGSDRR